MSPPPPILRRRYVAETGWPFELAQPFKWRLPTAAQAEASTPTPTPAAWVDAAMNVWGARPCLGLPLEAAPACVVARLPSAVEEAAAAAVLPGLGDTEGECPEPVFRISRGFAWLSYAQARPLVRSLAAAVRALPGISRGDLWGLCAPNCPEWLLADFAAALAGLCPVGFHVTYTAAELAAAVGRTQPALALVAPPQLGAWLAAVAAGVVPSLRAIVVLAREEGVTAAVAAARAAAAGGLLSEPDAAAARAAAATAARHLGVSFPGDSSSQSSSSSSEPPLLLSLEALLQRQRSRESLKGPAAALAVLGEPATQNSGRPDGLFTLLFTSGSSGAPKAVAVSGETWRRDIGDGPTAAKLVWPSGE